MFSLFLLYIDFSVVGSSDAETIPNCHSPASSWVDGEEVAVQPGPSGYRRGVVSRRADHHMTVAEANSKWFSVGANA